MKLRSVLIIGILSSLALFQNCQKSAYQGSSSSDSTQAAKADGNLAAVTTEDGEDASGVITQPPGTSSDSNMTTSTDDTKSPGNSGNAPGHASSSDDSSASGEMVCILDGPGKSVKLGLLPSGVPQGQNPVPQVLCMSANACSVIAAAYFKVKGPEFRGYCKAGGNPFVHPITDAQLKVKIDALISANKP